MVCQFPDDRCIEASTKEKLRGLADRAKIWIENNHLASKAKIEARIERCQTKLLESDWNHVEM